MTPELGRWLGHLPLEVKRLALALKDLAEGAGPKVRFEIEGREMVFRTEDGGRGFLRLRPSQTSVWVAFPKGEEIRDPAHRLSGPLGLQLSCEITHPIEMDHDFRRMVKEACGSPVED